MDSVRAFFHRAIALLVFGVICAGLGLYAGYRIWYTPAAFELVQSATVVKVTDGDTVWVQLDSGGDHIKIRLMGIDTPETVDPRKPKQCFGDEAKTQTKKLEGKRIKVEFLPTVWPPVKRDRNDRVLGYLFDGDGRNFNELLIRQGFAHEYTYHGAYKYQGEFKTAEVYAREHKLGMWHSESCEAESSRKR